MKILATVLSAISAVAITVVCGFAVWRENGWWIFAVGAAAVLALPLSSLLHELGHMLFGAVCKIKAVPKFSLFGSSFCRLVPKTDKNLRARLFVTGIGGVTVNIAVFVVIFAVAWLTSAPAWILFLAPTNLYLAVLNIIPAELAGGKTDGLFCTEILKNDGVAKVTVAVMAVQAQLLNGKQISEIDKNLLFNLPQIREDEPAFISLAELRSEYYRAVGDEENAALWLSRFEELKKEYSL